ncbi:MAG: liaR2 [Paenibacillaceae bacterium]|jgi:NarL family two-component system response regulator LiaR|nr:liaR2 [Paenibacillaceae bacterium]
MIVDDHDMVRLGLRAYLSQDDSIEVTAEAANGKEAIAHLQKLQSDQLPDLILMDMMMPVMDGVEATRLIAAASPDIKVIMLTSFLEDDKIVAAIEAGAAGYLLKTVSAEQLLKQIKDTLAGHPTMSPEVAGALTRGLRQRSAQSEQEDLTPREKEVLLLIADGKTNKEIADELHISIKTVKTHVSNLLMKCEQVDRTQLAIYAHRKGWSA